MTTNRNKSPVFTYIRFILGQNQISETKITRYGPPEATIFASRNKKTIYFRNSITTLYRTVHTASGAEFDIMAQGWESAYACN